MYHQLHCSRVQDGYTPGACFTVLVLPRDTILPRHLPSPSLGGVPSLSRHTPKHSSCPVDDLSRSREDGIPYPWVPCRWFWFQSVHKWSLLASVPPPRPRSPGICTLFYPQVLPSPTPRTPTPSHLPGTRLCQLLLFPDSSALTPSSFTAGSYLLENPAAGPTAPRFPSRIWASPPHSFLPPTLWNTASLRHSCPCEHCP